MWVPAADLPPGSPELSDRRAGRLAVGWSLLVTIFGLLLAVVVPFAVLSDRNGGYCETTDHPGPCMGLAAAVSPGLVVAAVGLCGVASGVAIARGRVWARRLALVVVSVSLAATVVTGVVSSFMPDASDAGAFTAVLGLVLCLTIGNAARYPDAGPSDRPGNGGPTGRRRRRPW